MAVVRREYYYRVEVVKYAPSLDEFDKPVGRGSIEVVCHRFRVVKRTPKGAWIDYYGYYGTPMEDGSVRPVNSTHYRFVGDNDKKQFASPTPEEAARHFIHRAKRYASIMRARAEQAWEAVTLALKGRILNRWPESEPETITVEDNIQ